MKGYYAIKNRNTGAIYQELTPCGRMRDKMFDSSIKALAFIHSRHVSEKIFEVVFVEVHDGKQN